MPEGIGYKKKKGPIDVKKSKKQIKKAQSELRDIAKKIGTTATRQATATEAVQGGFFPGVKKGETTKSKTYQKRKKKALEEAALKGYSGIEFVD